MKKNIGIFIIFPIALVLILCPGPGRINASAAEEGPPEQYGGTDLSKASTFEAFERLKMDGPYFDDAVLDEGVREAFSARKDQAIDLALNMLRVPRVRIVDGKIKNRADDLRVAKHIFTQFRGDSLARIEKEYSSADAVLKSNIIQMIAAIDPGGAGEQILAEALQDQTVCEDEYPVGEGIPMRICDVAYNQLVLLWQIKDVLRTIGVIHRLDVRDYHIKILKEKIGYFRRT